MSIKNSVLFCLFQTPSPPQCCWTSGPRISSATGTRAPTTGWRMLGRTLLARIYRNPFLFIRGLSCPSCIQASLSLNCLKLTIPNFLATVFLHLVVTLALKKNPRYSIGLEIRHQSAFTAFRALLPSANYSAEWPLVGYDSPLQVVMAFWRTIIVSRGLSHPTQKFWIQTLPCPLITYQGIFFKGGETL